LRELGNIKHLIKLNASNNQLRFSFDFKPPANLEWVDYSGNCIESISGCEGNRYLKYLYLDNNNIKCIEGLLSNKNLRVLSLNGNQISKIDNLENLWLEELFISANNLTEIKNLETLPVLRTLDFSKN
jgi:Leucine-rich repeat (LRR) protein